MTAVRIPGPADVNYVAPATDPGVRRATGADFGGGIAEAAGNLGAEFGAIGAKLATRIQDQRDAVGLTRFKIERNKAYYEQFLDAQKSAPPGAAGFYDGLWNRWEKEAPKSVTDFATNYGLSRGAAAHAAEIDMELRGQYGSKALAWGHNEAIRKLTDDTTQSIKDITESAAENGDFEGAQTEILNTIEAAKGLLDPEGEQALRDAAKKGLWDAGALYLGNNVAPSDRRSLIDPHGTMRKVVRGLSDAIGGASTRHGVSAEYLTRLAQVESDGGRNLVNANSTARGAFQFTSDTAQQYGLTDAMDFGSSADAAARLTKDNQAALTKALGRAPSAGELYLAHQQGAAGAVALLSDPNALAVDVVGEDAVRLNGGAPGMTAGEFAKKWIDKFEGVKSGKGAPAEDTWFSQNLPVEMRTKLLDAAEVDELQLKRDARVAETQAAAERAQAIGLGVETGQIKTRQEILDDPLIDDGDKTTLLNRLDAKQAEAAAADRILAAIHGDAVDLGLETGAVKTRDDILNDPQLSAKDKATLLRRFDDREAAAKRGESLSRKDALDLGIELNEVKSRDEILNDPLLDNGDKAVLLRRFDEKNKDAVAAAGVWKAITSGGPLPKEADLGLNQLFKAAGGVEALASGDSKTTATVGYFWNKVQAVPSDAKRVLEAMVRSGVQKSVVSGLAVLDGLQRKNPVAFHKAFDENTEKAVTYYQDRIGFASEKDIVDGLKALFDPQTIKMREPLVAKGLKEATKNYGADKIAGMFDASVLPFTAPNAPERVQDSLILESDFRRLYSEAYADDPVNAEKNAMRLLNRTWGQSETNGGTIMRYPPERYYPAVGASRDWMTEQLESDLIDLGYTAPERIVGNAVTGHTTTARPYVIQPIPLTESDIAAGRPPHYAVLVENPETGEWDAVLDKDGGALAYSWDASPVLEKRRAEFAVKNAAEAERRRTLVQPDAAGMADKNFILGQP